MGWAGVWVLWGHGGNQCISISNALTFHSEVSLLIGAERKKYAAISDIFRILQKGLI